MPGDDAIEDTINGEPIGDSGVPTCIRSRLGLKVPCSY